MIDSVNIARESPDTEQPWADLGLKQDEYESIKEILGRRPTSSELAMYSVMWSEHCSYKSSKVHLRQFGDKAPKTDALLVGIGENAGVVDIGDACQHIANELLVPRHINEANNCAVLAQGLIGESQINGQAARFFFGQSVGVDACQ